MQVCVIVETFEIFITFTLVEWIPFLEIEEVTTKFRETGIKIKVEKIVPARVRKKDAREPEKLLPRIILWCNKPDHASWKNNMGVLIPQMLSQT